MPDKISLLRCWLVFGACVALQAQQTSGTPPQPGTADQTQSTPADEAARKQKAEEQIKQQEHQRILGIIPEFNTSNVADAESLSPRQKFRLAFASVLDPAAFAFAGLDAGLSQWNNSYAGYGQGAEGYSKRFGAAYLDTFDGTMLGNAVFPSLLHQDPRYFRKGTGSFSHRLAYAISTTVICKNDRGHWSPNYSNVLGNFAAGGISNLYYPSTDRGADLTVERALTVTAEGAFGAIFYEFWPDVSRKFSKKKQ